MMVKRKVPYVYKILFSILSIIILIYFISCLHITFNMDEEFTMSLVKFPYSKILYVDSLDVHPPLYYLMLKIFIQSTTFWTNSPFIKVASARAFSVIIYIITFSILLKLISKISANVNKFMQFLFYLYMPNVLLYSTTIRMYQLAALFISLEFYYIFKYYKYNKNYYLFISVVWASFSAYTHYFAAVSAGLFIFIFFIRSFLKKDYKNSIKFLLSGALFISLYSPIVPFVFGQFQYEKSNHSNDFIISTRNAYASLVGINNNTGIYRILFISLIVVLFVLLIYWSYLKMSNIFNVYLWIVLSNVLLTIFIGLLFNFIKGTPFVSRFIYPVYTIYSFFLVSIFIRFMTIHYKNYRIIKIIMILLSLLFVFNSCKSFVKNINKFDKPSVTLMEKYNIWKHKENRNVYVNNSIHNSKALYITQSSFYLKYLHKNVVIKKNSVKRIRIKLLAHNNIKLFKLCFSNIKYIK